VDRDRRYLAGRANGCDLVLSSEHVSREHAAFVRRWDGVVVFDLGSSNGVLVNGHPIAGDLKLADGDRIDVGPVVLRLTDPEDRYLRRMERLASEPAEKSTVVMAAAPDGNAAESGGAIATPPVVAAVAMRPVVAAVAMRPLGRDVRKVDGAARSPRWPSWVVSALVAAIVVVAIAGLVLLFAAAG
jgi:pSer/pThr/pTyr-binding forkhead associated (FHA) protein